jgi:hypothetical protein
VPRVEAGGRAIAVVSFDCYGIFTRITVNEYNSDVVRRSGQTEWETVAAIVGDVSSLAFYCIDWGI